MDIIIAGDSWGLGEWGQVYGKYKPVHAGTAHFLASWFPDHNIKNTARAGSSNQAAIARLAKEPSCNICVFFQTDAMRDLQPYQGNATFLKLSCYQDVYDINRRLLDNTYQKLQDLGYEILLIGGCAKLHVDLIARYQNLVPLIPSVAEMLIPGHEQTLFPYGDYLDHIKLIFKDRSKLDDLIKIGQVFKNEHKVAACKEYFYPDMHHCNRQGHEKIAAVIDDYIRNTTTTLM